MNLLTIGSSGAPVAALQRQLAALGWEVGAADSVFGVKTRRAVVAFQQSTGLAADGIVGPKTIAALGQAVAGVPPAIKPLPIPRPEGVRGKLLAVAEAEIGVIEVPNGSNGGPRVDVYTGGVRLAWCAYFLSWCVRQADPDRIPKAIPRVVDWRAMFEREGELHPADGSYTPRPGDVFLMLYQDGEGVDTGHGHTGIVRAWDEAKVEITTIEGNASNGVRCRARALSSLTAFGVLYP